MESTINNFRIISIARIFSLLMPIMLTGCAAIAPSIEDQARAMDAADLTAEQRYAVVSRNSNTHAGALFVIEPDVTEQIAALASKRLGIEAVPLVHVPDSPWWNELQRAENATGWIATSDNKEFFRDQGFDGYIMITFWGDYFWREINGERKDYATFDPVFHIVTLYQGEEFEYLMSQKPTGKFRCDMGSGTPLNRQGCVNRFVSKFSAALTSRGK